MDEHELITKVDALINRHRAAAPHDEPQLEGRADDLPVLTEVVATAGSVVQLHDEVPAGVDDHAETRAALARELERWLDEKLPHAVLRVLDGLSDQLIAQVAAQARLDLLPRLKDALEPKSGDD